MKKIWAYVLSAFSLLLGLFFWERSKRQDAEAKLDNAETKKDDAVLNQHSVDVQAQIERDRLEAERLKKQGASDQELLDFLNKDKQ